MLQTSPVWALVWLFFQIQCSLFVFFWVSDSQVFTFTLRSQSRYQAQSRYQYLLSLVLPGPRIGGPSLRHHPKKGKRINNILTLTKRIDPGEGEISKFQPWEVQEGDTEPLCGGTLLSAWTCYVDKGSEKDSESFSLRLSRRTETFALHFPCLAGPSWTNMGKVM